MTFGDGRFGDKVLGEFVKQISLRIKLFYSDDLNFYSRSSVVIQIPIIIKLNKN
jgi:hypothetical protein